MHASTHSAIADIYPRRTLAGRLFDGPTLVQVTPPNPSRRMFGAIQNRVRPGSHVYSRYIESKEFAKAVYEDKYRGEKYVCDMSVVEPHDHRSVILYSLNSESRVVGTLRLCLDTGDGLPMANDVADVISALRRQGQTVAEPGRFATTAGKRISRCLISAAYEIARVAGIDVYLMQCRADHCDFYASQLAAQVLENYPAPEGCVNMIWRVAETPDAFFTRFGRNRLELENPLLEPENEDD